VRREGWWAKRDTLYGVLYGVWCVVYDAQARHTLLVANSYSINSTLTLPH
jgi:hypothetical protein